MVNTNQVKNAKLILSNCLALTIRKEGTVHNYSGEFWMYENGYLLFQGFLSANSVCWWNESLCEAQRHLQYYGYVAPGILLISADSYSLEVIRNAWSKFVLKSPSGYVITDIGEIDNCIVTPCIQGQFTPLPEAICEAVFQLTSRGKPAVPELIKITLFDLFPHIQQPNERLIYDCLVQLAAERKLYQTSKGYFIVTPERRRSRSHSRRQRRSSHIRNGLLMSNEEALALIHGDITTIRDGDLTHQCIQTNLTDVVCGGNEFDKVIYARREKNFRQSPSFPVQENLERRHSFRLFSNHSKKLKRSVSTCTISKKITSRTSTIDDFSTLSSHHSDLPIDKRRISFFAKWFRKSKRSKNGTLNGQFPPMEWFNSKIVHLHNVATQTCNSDIEYSSMLYATNNNLERLLNRSSETLPRSLKSSSNRTITETAKKSSSNNRHSMHYVSSTLPKSYHKSRSLHRSKPLTPQPVPFYEPLEPKKSSESKSSGPSSLESTTNKSGPSSLESQVTILPANKTSKLNDTNDSHNKNNSAFTLQVKTNQKQNSNENNQLTVTKSMTTINSGKNTKIYVENSPIRSVITFENRQKHDTDPNVVIINGSDEKCGADRKNYSTENTRKDQKNKLNENMNNENQKMNNNNNKDELNVLKTNLLKSENSLEHLDVINNCWPVSNEPQSKVFQFPSLNDLNCLNNFTSLTAQNILKGISSVETLLDKNNQPDIKFV